MATSGIFNENAHLASNRLIHSLRQFVDLPAHLSQTRRTHAESDELRRSLDRLDSFHLDDIGIERIEETPSHWSLLRPARQWSYRSKQAATRDADVQP